MLSDKELIEIGLKDQRMVKLKVLKGLAENISISSHHDNKELINLIETSISEIKSLNDRLENEYPLSDECPF